jgi:CubicO group peptidase (beta-lactamase class C family)
MAEQGLSRRQFSLGVTAATAALAAPGPAASKPAAAGPHKAGAASAHPSAEPPAPVAANPRFEAVARQARQVGSRALVVVHRGETLLADGPVSEIQRIASCRKSFISALYGMAVDAGKIDLGATLSDVGIDDYSPLSEAEKKATVKDLLKARSGVYIPASAETQHMKDLRPGRGSHPPGTFWYYNNWDFNVLGEIYQRFTGEGLFAAIEQRLAIPLGWQDFKVLEHTQWGYDPAAPRFGAYGMLMSARDMARLGQLYASRGKWDGKQLISERWIDESTQAYSTTTFDGGVLGGYGYLWWLVTVQAGKSTDGLPAGAFSAAGNGGRYITVFPKEEIVVAVQPEEHEGQPPATIFTKPETYSALLRAILDAAG